MEMREMTLYLQGKTFQMAWDFKLDTKEQFDMFSFNDEGKIKGHPRILHPVKISFLKNDYE